MSGDDAAKRGRRRSDLSGEAREASGVTSALLLSYLDRAGGPAIVAQVLERCGLGQCEEELRDENCWFSWETKIELFEAAAAVLEKPDFLTEMAAQALDSGVAGTLKVALRTLGSPEFVLRNIVGANARFNRSHLLELLELHRGHALVRFAELGRGRRYHRLDCDYTAAMLGVIPELFGLTAGHVSHVQCAADGADACLFELHWAERGASGIWTLAAGGATAAAALASVLLLPAALPLVGAGGALAGGMVLRERWRWRRRQLRHLQRQVEDTDEVAERLSASLQDVLSDLRLEEVFAKVTRNAQVAVGGREFVLLVREGGELSCESSSDLPASAIAAVEAWANGSPRLLERPLVIDDVSALEGLQGLAELDSPLCSLVTAPLHSAGDSLGLLVALGGQRRTFLPSDVAVLESYAAQVTIALCNARRFQTERSLAARDALSGLLNHRSFHEALDAELARCEGEQFYSSVVLLDLDRFKQVNDEDGHAAGDRLLRAVARSISEVCRRDDLAFRIGGDEFALLLPRLVEDEAVEVARRVCSAIARLDPRIGASAGVACAGPSNTDKDALLARADLRLYAAKRGEGRLAGHRGISTGRTITACHALDLLLAALELHHPPSARHCEAVAALADSVADRLGLGRSDCELVRHAALVHDIGKLALARTALDKRSALSPAQWELVRRQPEDGAELLRRVEALAPLAEIVRAGRERWDGAGYPAGLRGAEIPFAARVVAACDAFDAMRSGRPYRAARSQAEALDELRRCAGTQFDPDVVEALAAHLSAVQPLS